MNECEYSSPGMKYRINDRGAVVNPDKVKIIVGGGKIEMRYAQTGPSTSSGTGEWYGAWSVYAVGFSGGYAVFFPARVCLDEYGVVVEPVKWVEDQPVEAFREIILDRMCERVIAWLDHQKFLKPWYAAKMDRMIEALQNPDLSEEREILYERVVRRAEGKKEQVEQLSLWG